MGKFFLAAGLCLLLAVAQAAKAAPLAPRPHAPSGILYVHDISRYGTFCEREACPFGAMTAGQTAAEEAAVAAREAALKQLGGLLASFLLFCLGGLKGLVMLRWRRQGQRVEGKIAGVLDMPRFRVLKSTEPLKFTPVMHFRLSRKDYEARLDQSFIQPEEVVTGATLPLLVLANDPSLARRADVKTLDLLDICLVIFAAVLAAASFSQPPILPLTLALAAAMLAFVLWHVARIWMPAGSLVPPRKLALGAAYGVRPVEDILKERADKLRQREKLP